MVIQYIHADFIARMRCDYIHEMNGSRLYHCYWVSNDFNLMVNWRINLVVRNNDFHPM